MRKLSRLFHLFIGNTFVGVFHISTKRIREKHRILKNNSYGISKCVRSYASYLLAVNGYLAAVIVVESHEKIDNRRLAAAGGTDQRDLLSGFYLQVEITNYLLTRNIAKINMLKFYYTVVDLEVRITALILFLFIKDAKYSLGTGDGSLYLAI